MNTTTRTKLRELIDSKLETELMCASIPAELTVSQALGLIGLLGVEITEKGLRRAIEREAVEVVRRDGRLFLPLKSVADVVERQVAQGKVLADEWLKFLDDAQAERAAERNKEVSRYAMAWAGRSVPELLHELPGQVDERKRRVLCGILLASFETMCRMIGDPFDGQQ